MMRKDNYQDFQGNDQYEGFCVDMLRELADILKFSFKLKLVDDGLYGAPEPNGSWTGMVGELINRVSPCPAEPLKTTGSLCLGTETIFTMPGHSLAINKAKEVAINFQNSFIVMQCGERRIAANRLTNKCACLWLGCRPRFWNECHIITRWRSDRLRNVMDGSP